MAVASLAAGACGSIPEVEPGADGGVDARPLPPGSTAYRGTLASSAEVRFGGPYNGTPYCYYTITLKQIELSLVVSSTGAITDGAAQDLAVEAVVQPCEYPPLPAQIHKYTFRSATPTSSGHMVVMDSLSTNSPKTSLAITVTASGGAYSAAARWTRTDIDPPFNWSVAAPLTLTLVK